MNPNDAKDAILTTDYPIDQIVGYNIGSFSVASGQTATPSFSHGLGYAPLYYVKWSNDSNFSNSYDQTGFVGISSYALTVQSDASNIYIFALNLGPSTVTFYYRILYFMPSDVDIEAPSTQSSLDNFNLNTDFNYTKLLLSGVTASQNATITHGLGYYPQVEAWYVRSFDSRVVYSNGDLPDGTWVPVSSINTDSLVLSDTTGTASRWHYRIYVDEV